MIREESGCGAGGTAGEYEDSKGVVLFSERVICCEPPKLPEEDAGSLAAPSVTTGWVTSREVDARRRVARLRLLEKASWALWCMVMLLSGLDEPRHATHALNDARNFKCEVRHAGHISRLAVWLEHLSTG